jgi:hypothetical protein
MSITGLHINTKTITTILCISMPHCIDRTRVLVRVYGSGVTGGGILHLFSCCRSQAEKSCVPAKVNMHSTQSFDHGGWRIVPLTKSKRRSCSSKKRLCPRMRLVLILELCRWESRRRGKIRCCGDVPFPCDCVYSAICCPAVALGWVWSSGLGWLVVGGIFPTYYIGPTHSQETESCG